MFHDLKLRSFFLEQGLNRSGFREDKLYDHDVDMVFSMNQTAIQQVHAKYAKLSQVKSSKKKIQDATPTISLQWCEHLIKKDMGLDVTKKTIQECFALSKSIVVNEHDRRDLAAYDRMGYLEFLEFISRVSEVWLRETEMEELPLHNKIEEFLTQLLDLVDTKLVRQQVTIQEFSDSDDDY